MEVVLNIRVDNVKMFQNICFCTALYVRGRSGVVCYNNEDTHTSGRVIGIQQLSIHKLPLRLLYFNIYWIFIIFY